MLTRLSNHFLRQSIAPVTLPAFRNVVFSSPFTLPDIPEMSLPDFVMKDFDTFGDKQAIVDAFTGASLSYNECKDHTYRFANALSSRFGFQKDDCVAVVSPNNLNYFASFFGPTLLGGFTTTINPLYTHEEIEKQVTASNSSILVCHPAVLPNVQPVADKLGLPLIVFGEEGLPEGAFSFEQLVREADPTSVHQPPLSSVDAIATLPYSSGTTGPPKGTMLTHRNIIANTMQCFDCETKHIDTTSSVLCPLPLFHCYGMVVGLCATMSRGGRLVITPSFDAEKFFQAIETYKVDRIHAVPPIVLALAKHPSVDKYDMSSVKSVLSGAAPLGADLQRQCGERLDCVSKQAWGMTELSPAATISPDENVRLGSAGLLVPGCEAKILDTETGAELGVEEQGELCIRGPNVFKGYLNNEEATATTIMADGFLKTGDIAKIDSDGFVFILDRSKELIKYKGFQVAPAELEGIIGAREEVNDVLVIPVPDDEAGEVPKAFVSLKPGFQMTPEEVAAHVAEHVAHYKRLRGGVEIVEEVPRSASGKLLRRLVVEQERKKREQGTQ